MSKLQWFYDSKCTKPIKTLENVGFSKDIIEAGETTEIIYYLKNVTEDKIDKIKITVDDDEVKVIQELDSLKPAEFMAVHFTFSPSETREEALQTVIRLLFRVIKEPKGWKA